MEIPGDFKMKEFEKFYKPKEVIFHIGSPKTATTTVQSWLSENSRRLMAQGVQVYTPSKVRPTPHFRKFQRFYRRSDVKTDAGKFLRLFEDERPSRVLISEEAFSNDLIPNRKVGDGGFSRIDRTAQFIQELNLPSVLIVLTVRRQDTFLKSCYAHLVSRAGLTLSFEDWVGNEVNIENLSWKRQVAQLEAAFGQASVKVLPFEMLKESGDEGFYRRFLTEVGLQGEDHVEPRRKRANESMTQGAIDIARNVNAFEISGRAEAQKRRNLISQINEFISESGGKKFNVDLSPVTERCRSLYAEENESLAAQKFPDLKTEFTFEDV